MNQPQTPRARAAGVLAAATTVVAAIVVAVLVVSSGGRSSGRPGPRAQSAPSSTSPAQSRPPTQAPPAGEQFGASVNYLFNAQSYSAAEIGSQLEALRRSGATIARTDAFWETTEPQPPVGGVHHYQWAFDDLIAGSLAAHHLRWLAIIDYSAPWAQSIPGRDHSPPRSDSDYAAYAAAFAARYGPGGSFWAAHPQLPEEPIETYEVWNEPDNLVFWSSSGGASRYVQLYLQTRKAITAIQPRARVIVGGLTHPTAFLTQMLAARPDLREHLDGVAIHPYGRNPKVVLANVAAARATLDSLGMRGVALYATEFGWTTSPVGALGWVPAASRPTYIAQTLAALGHLDCGLDAAILYTWVTPGRNPLNKEDWFGIHPPHGGNSSDSMAFTQGLQAATRPAATLDLCGAR